MLAERTPPFVGVRMNRVEQLKEHTAGDTSINYAAGSTAGTVSNPTAASSVRCSRSRTIQLRGWIADRIERRRRRILDGSKANRESGRKEGLR